MSYYFEKNSSKTRSGGGSDDPWKSAKEGYEWIKKNTRGIKELYDSYLFGQQMRDPENVRYPVWEYRGGRSGGAGKAWQYARGMYDDPVGGAAAALQDIMDTASNVRPPLSTGMPGGIKRRAPRAGLPVTKRPKVDPPPYDPPGPRDVVMEPVRSPQNKMLLGARKWRSSNTHGYSGVMRKRYRRLPIDSVAKNGAALVQEVGSTFNGVECVYVGHHQAPIKKLIRAFAMALTRRIAKVLHQDFNSFEELMHKYYNIGETTTKLQLKYKTGIDGLVINATDVTYSNGDTWRTFAEKIADALIGAMNGTRNFELVDIVIASTTAADIAPVPMHRWNPRNMYLAFNCVSKLTFQNETLADEVGASHHEDSAHITNNPLRGRAYMFRGNYLRFRNHDPDSAVGQQAIAANNGTGVIAIAADDFADVPNLNTLQKLPPAYFFEGKVKTYNFTLAPGEIKKSIIKWKKTMGINTFLQRVLDCAQSAASDVDQIINGYSNPIGWSEVFAMEKECDTGATGGEPQVQVGYEINTYVSCIVKGGKYVPTVPHVVVADS